MESAILIAVVTLILQKTLVNIIAGVLLRLRKPFRKYHHIEVLNNQFKVASGEVLSIGLFATRIKTYEKDIISIPNGPLLDTYVIKNHDDIEKVNFVETLSFTPDSNIEKIKEIIKQVVLSNKYTYNTEDTLFITMRIIDGKLVFKYNLKTKNINESFNANNMISQLIATICQSEDDITLI